MNKKYHKHMNLKTYIRSQPIEVQRAFKTERAKLEIHRWKTDAKELKKIAELMAIELRKKMTSCAEFCSPPYVSVGGHICNPAHCHKSIMAHFEAKARQFFGGVGR